MRRENNITTIKEKLETIKGKKIAILVENEEQDDILVDALNLITHEDCIGFWCNQRICYSLDEFYDTQSWDYGNIETFMSLGGYDIVRYCDFVEGIDDLGFVELTQQDINAILDGKYGKDNWVIK